MSDSPTPTGPEAATPEIPTTVEALATQFARLERELATVREDNVHLRAALNAMTGAVPTGAVSAARGGRVGRKGTDPRHGVARAASVSTSRRGLLRLGGAAAAAGAVAAAANIATGTRDAHASGVAWATGTVNADNQTYVQPSSGSYPDSTILTAQYGTGTVYQPFNMTSAIAGYDTTSASDGQGVFGTSAGGVGVAGATNTGWAVIGNSTGSGFGVWCVSSSGNAVYAGNGGFAAAPKGGGPAHRPIPTSSGPGTPSINANSDIGAAVDANSSVGGGYSAVFANGTSGTNGLNASSDTGYGAIAHSASGTGLSASSGSGSAVVASSSGVGYGLYLTAPSGWAIGCVGRIRVIGQSVGTVTLAHGTTTKTVSTNACSSSSNVILTPTSDPLVRIWAMAAPGAFTIHASSAPTSDVTFTYLLIN